MDSPAKYRVGLRTNQLIHVHADGGDSLINIVDSTGVIVAGFHSQDLAERTVKLLNRYEELING